jgi:hypothetical protein
VIPSAQRSFGENLCRALGSTVRSNGNSCSANLLRQFGPIRPLLIIKSRNAVSSGTVRRDNCTVRRSLLVDAGKLWRSCCCRRRKVRRSLFRKVSSSRSRPATTRSRMHPLQPLRLRKLRGDMPADELCG